MNRLACLAEESLRRYVFRITLDEALTQDIVQEVMLEMVKVLGKLRRVDRFISWLHGIALNVIRRHYGERWRDKAAGGRGEEAYAGGGAGGQEGLANLVNAELKQIIFSAMNGLEPRHRAVLTMRCYDGMSYKEIGETMGMREFSARALFFRAKKALARQLSRRGLGRGSLLTALVLFGKMTAVSEAAAAEVAITAATLKVGLAAGVAGTAGAASPTAVATLTAATVIAAAAVVGVNGSDEGGAAAGGETRQVLPTTPARAAEGDVRECWYYFPEGIQGPVMMRSMIADPAGRPRYCQWLQNEAGNYRYDARSNTITLNNGRTWEEDYSVRRLPTDSPELSDFISEVQGDSAVMEYIGSRGRDVLVVARSGHGESGASWTTRHCNAMEEDYFKCDWPRGATLIDNRDAMHRRGWTYFTVRGRLGGEAVSGCGRLPFVYAAGGSGAWLRLRVGEREVAGDARNVWVCDAQGKVLQGWSDVTCGGIFAGLGRPWAGLHTIDTVRRDAAMRRIRFETRVDGRKATVVLDCGELKVRYVIDMPDDLVEEITFAAAEGTKVGDLKFAYGEEGESVGGPPSGSRTLSRAGVEESEGMLWLVKLGKGVM